MLQSIIGAIEAILYAGRLSLTTTAPTQSFGTKKNSINTSNALPSMKSFIVINYTKLLLLIAQISVIFAPDKMVLNHILGCGELSEHTFYLKRI